jgi:cellulose synthase/poly-beta-1,6-N-acetylglucosamine synthase-like glycosyltransferase
MLFSIIIPVRGINAFLKENIYHLKQLDYKDFEVLIVVDDKEHYDFEGDTRFKLVVSGKEGPGEKRNIGARASCGDVLAFLDDDAYPDIKWLTYAYEVFQNPNVFALGAPALTPLNAPFLEKLSGFILSSPLASAGTVYRYKPSTPCKIDDYPTVNLFVRREDFLKIGGFIKEFWPGEDTKLCLDLIKMHGRNFDYDPRPVVCHHRRNFFTKPKWEGSILKYSYSLSPHLKQVSRYGQHRGQFARIFPDTSFRLSYFIPSLFVLGLVTGWISWFIFKPLAYIYIGILALYFCLLVEEGVRVFVKEKIPGYLLLMPVGIFLTHLIYGINFIIGFNRKPTLKLKNYDSRTGNYVEG